MIFFLYCELAGEKKHKRTHFKLPLSVTLVKRRDGRLSALNVPQAGSANFPFASRYLLTMHRRERFRISEGSRGRRWESSGGEGGSWKVSWSGENTHRKKQMEGVKGGAGVLAHRRIDPWNSSGRGRIRGCPPQRVPRLLCRSRFL